MELVKRKKRIKPLCQLLGIEEPIIQAPMAGGVISAEFSAKVSYAGLLGSLASGYLTLEQTKQLIQSFRQNSKQAFQLNILVDDSPAHSPLPQSKDEAVIRVEKLFGIHEEATVSLPDVPSLSEMVDLAIASNVPIISTAFGLLDADNLQKIKAAGITLMTTINSIADAHQAMALNAPQVLIYQNKLAGGHQGGLSHAQEMECDVSDTAILSLKKSYPQVLIVKAGGIVTREDVVLALRQGFDGVQIGTGFLATQESNATEEHKQGILDMHKVCDTCFSRSVTGRQARGIKNQLMQLALSDTSFYPVHHYATTPLRDFAIKHKLKEYQSLWTGTGAVKIDKIPSLQAYMESIIKYPIRQISQHPRKPYVASEINFELHG